MLSLSGWTYDTRTGTIDRAVVEHFDQTLEVCPPLLGVERRRWRRRRVDGVVRHHIRAVRCCHIRQLVLRLLVTSRRGYDGGRKVGIYVHVLTRDG